MAITPEDIIKILLAILEGGLIGLEREFRDKAAGFRTIIFICVGACLFTLLSVKFSPDSDPNRIAANIVRASGLSYAFRDLVTGDDVELKEELLLAPYQFLWLIAN